MPTPDIDIGPGSAQYIVLQLAQTEVAWAKGATLYGENGLFDTQRKIELDSICQSIREALDDAGQKRTEAAITQEAHSRPRYVEMVKQAAREREAWLLLDVQRRRWLVTLATLSGLVIVNSMTLAGGVKAQGDI